MVIKIKRYELGLDRIGSSILFRIADGSRCPCNLLFEGLKVHPMKQNSEDGIYAFEGDANELIAAYHGKTSEERVEVFDLAVSRGKPDPGMLN